MDGHHDYQGLARMVAAGMPLDEAAARCAIPMEAVLAHAKERMAVGDALPWQLRLVAQRALGCAVSNLEAIAGERMRSKHQGTADVTAAGELAKLAIAALKLAQPPRAARKESAGAAAAELDKGMWATLKTPGV